MATAEDVARSALASVDTDAPILLAVKWVSERYRELTTRAKFRHLRRMSEIHIDAPIIGGTASVTRDSNIVVGDATASPLWTSNLIGRHFRAQISWYEIVDVIPDPAAAQLVLKTSYGENASGFTGYRIVERFVRLDKNVRFVGKFLHMRRRRPLRWMSRLELDMAYPARNNITGGPRIVSDSGVDADGRWLVEFYPYSDVSEQIVYTYWPVSPSFEAEDPIPREMDVVLLKAGVLIDVMRYEMSRAVREGHVEAAGLWRNESRAQSTEWEGKIMDAIRADRGVDDLTFILRTTGMAPLDEPLIQNAHDEVLARWPL